MSERSIRQLAEAINKGIAAATGGDHCFNVAHLMRVPGTVNFPTPAKVRCGRGVTLASVLRRDNGRTVTFDGMAAFKGPDQSRIPDRPHIDTGETELLTANDLNLSRYDDLRYLIDAPDGADRSKDTYWLAHRMAERGFDDGKIVGILLNPANAVAAHCVENSDPERAAVRALVSAKRKLSEKGQVVADNGGGDPQSLPLIDAGALDGVEVASRVFQVEKLIPAALLSLFTGPGGGGKSYVSLNLAASVALGALAFGLTPSGRDNLVTAILNELIDNEVIDPSDPMDVARFISKIHVPNEHRIECLNTLRKMNIHHANLFPDAGGASKYCNDWLSRLIEEEKRDAAEAQAQAIEEAADLALAEPDPALIAGEAISTDAIAKLLRKTLRDDSQFPLDMLSGWASKLINLYERTADTDWPERPASQVRLKLDFRKFFLSNGIEKEMAEICARRMIGLFMAAWRATNAP